MHRDAAEQDDQARTDQGDLACQIRAAGRQLGGLGRAVSGRAALDGIGDVHVLATLKVDRRQHRVEQTAGLTDKGFAAFVLVGPRTFADEQPVGLDVTDAGHGLLAPLAQRTGTAGADRVIKLRPGEHGRAGIVREARHLGAGRRLECGRLDIHRRFGRCRLNSSRHRQSFRRPDGLRVAAHPERGNAHFGQQALARQAHALTSSSVRSSTSASSRPPSAG